MKNFRKEGFGCLVGCCELGLLYVGWVCFDFLIGVYVFELGTIDFFVDRKSLYWCKWKIIDFFISKFNYFFCQMKFDISV